MSSSPPGKFTMEMLTAGDGRECHPDEKPAHDVEITKKGFLNQTDARDTGSIPACDRPESERVQRTGPAGGTGELGRSAQLLPGGQVSGFPLKRKWEYAARASSTAAGYLAIWMILHGYAGSLAETRRMTLRRKSRTIWGLHRHAREHAVQWTADGYDPEIL